MRTALALILSGWIFLPAAGQEIDVILPDTSLRALTVAEVLPYFHERLTSLGTMGQLGSTYRLGRAVLDQQGGHPVLAYHNEEVPIPLPDTLVIRGTDGEWLPHLAPFFFAGNFPEGSTLTSAERPAWQVKTRRYFRSGSGYGVFYNLADISTRKVQLLLAYDRQEDRSGHLVGEVMVDLPNLLGTLRYVGIHWRRLSLATQTIQLLYAEPRLPLLPLGARIRFHQDLRDTLYLQREVRFQVTSLPGQVWSTAIGVGVRELQVTDNGRSQNLIPYRQRNLNLSVAREDFDHPLNPGHGFRVSLELEGGTVHGREMNSRAALGEVQLNMEGVISIVSLTLHQQLQAVDLLSYRYTPQLSEFARFGGGATLRGYREDQFLVPWGVVSRTELRLRTGATTRFHLFLDVGRLAIVRNVGSAGFGLVLKA